ncbi:hypothetical protein BDQ17DRAFT_1430630 [Cyathus striatus]|nr:hypothetical protein BDQ17DRAFT_1430630 [Cyathus striatus]
MSHLTRVQKQRAITNLLFNECSQSPVSHPGSRMVAATSIPHSQSPTRYRAAAVTPNTRSLSAALPPPSRTANTCSDHSGTLVTSHPEHANTNGLSHLSQIATAIVSPFTYTVPSIQPYLSRKTH